MAQDPPGTQLYYRVQFHADRLHCRRDICRRTDRLSMIELIKMDGWMDGWIDTKNRLKLNIFHTRIEMFHGPGPRA